MRIRSSKGREKKDMSLGVWIYCYTYVYIDMYCHSCMVAAYKLHMYVWTLGLSQRCEEPFLPSHGTRDAVTEAACARRSHPSSSFSTTTKSWKDFLSLLQKTSFPSVCLYSLCHTITITIVVVVVVIIIIYQRV